MKKYFEYIFNSEIKKKLSDYYENLSLDQHNKNHLNKADIKLKRILNLLSFSTQDKVLDVGCSRGYILKTIAPLINKGKGVDISKAIIQLNNKNNHLANISFDVFDGKILTLSEKYNKVLLIDVLEHAFYPDELIITIKNAMVSNGLCVIGVPFSGFLSELIFGKYHQGHLRYYDPDYLSNYIEKFGFEIIKIKIHNSVPWSSQLIKVPFLHNLLDFLVNLIPSKIYPYFGEILVLAKNEE